MANLNACVKQILCALSTPALSTLQAIINSQKTILQAQIAALQVQLIQYDVIAIPLQAEKALAQAVIDEVRGTANLVPLNVIAGCADIGDFNLRLNQSIDQVTSQLDDKVFEVTRLLSYRNELNALINELNANINRFTDINNIITQCMSGT